MRVQHATDLRARLMYGAVNHKTGWIDREGTVMQFAAFHVDLDETGGRDFLEHHPIGIDQELVRVAGHGSGKLGTDMGEHQVAPAVKGNQAVAGSKIAPQRPFLRADGVF